MVATKKLILPMTKVTIRKIAKITPATRIGHFKIFCKTIEIMITAIGKAKNSNNIFITSLLFFLLYVMFIFCFWLIIPKN